MKNTIKFIDGKTLEAGTCFCVGQNYAKHAAEMGSKVSEEPVIFFKPGQAVECEPENIILPEYSADIHHEVELVVAIGSDCTDIEESEAHKYIAGYAVGIDLTLRDLQAKAKKAGMPWAVAKGFRSSAPVSRFIPADSVESNIFDLEIKVNGETKQKSSTNEMSRSIEYLISYLSKIFTLKQGDLVFTGTPEGVGSLVAGDTAEALLNDKTMLKINFR